jgi:uracil-DNA glycosylase family 4
MARIFINYRRQDSEGYAGRLYDFLTQIFDEQDVFMDVDSIAPGADFVQTLEAGVAACDIFLALIGPHWLSASHESGQRRLDQADDFVRIEIATALRHEKIIIPLLVGEASMPAAADLPDEIAPLARRNAIVLGHQRFGADARRLVDTIRQVIHAAHSPKPRADAATLRQNEQALKAIREELIKATDSPLYSFRISSGYYPVPGEGNPDAAIMFIGESPGKNEAAIGKPFVGPSGDVLDEMLDGIHLRREDVFITNLLLDHPSDREPLPEEIDFYAPYLDRIIDIVRPAVIATLGRFAMQYLLKKFDTPQKREKISALHGQPIPITLPHGEIALVPLYHPAVVLYSATQKDVLQADFEALRVYV